MQYYFSMLQNSNRRADCVPRGCPTSYRKRKIDLSTAFEEGSRRRLGIALVLYNAGWLWRVIVVEFRNGTSHATVKADSRISNWVNRPFVGRTSSMLFCPLQSFATSRRTWSLVYNVFLRLQMSQFIVQCSAVFGLKQAKYVFQNLLTMLLLCLRHALKIILCFAVIKYPI